MKVVWSPENASKAYIDTVKSCELYQESGVAELISAMAAGWNSKLIVETWSNGNFIPRSIGLAIAARHTSGRHVCIVPDERSRSDYTQAMSASNTGVSSPEILVGEPEEVMSELECVDFLVVDNRRRDFARFLRLARLSSRGAVLVCKNACAKTASSACKWRGILDAGKYRVVRTAFLPVGPGLDIAHVAASGGLGSGETTNKRRWIRHVDQVSGEEHVIRTT
ncbi:Calsyntenin-2 [Bienertia sinuspersici]